MTESFFHVSHRHIVRLLVLISFGWLSAPATLAGQNLDFLAGQWCQYSDNGVTTESWLEPVDEEMLGIGRTVSEGKQLAWEFLQISRDEGDMKYIARPNGRPGTAFTRTDGGTDWVRFENPKHDFPTRIEYRRRDESLEATVSGPGKDGTESVISFVYEPCEPQKNRRQ